MRDDYRMSRDERGSSAGRSDNMPFHNVRSNIPNARYAKVIRTEKKGTNIQVVVRCRSVTLSFCGSYVAEWLTLLIYLEGELKKR
jgi:hypothetical protein